MSQPDPWNAPTGLPAAADPQAAEQQPGSSAPQYGHPQSSQPQSGQPHYGQPQSGWGQPGGYGPPPQRGTNTMAILSLVFAFIFAPAGIVMGVIAKRQIRERHEGGSGSGDRRHRDQCGIDSPGRPAVRAHRGRRGTLHRLHHVAAVPPGLGGRLLRFRDRLQPSDKRRIHREAQLPGG